jgi:ketosteroid isomerase-like protein
VSSPDREAVIRELFQRLSAHEWESASELTTEDVEFELAYAPDFMEMPVRGRAGLVNLYTSILGAMFDDFTLTPDEFILGADPDVAVATYTSDAVVKQNGKPYRNRYIGIIRFRDGEISMWREYHNPEEISRAMSD